MGNNSSYESKIKDPEFKWIPSRDYWLTLKPSDRLTELAELCWHENLYNTFYSLDRHAVFRIFKTFPWPEGTTKDATNAFNNMVDPELYAQRNLSWARYHLERNIKYLLFLIGREVVALHEKESQESRPQAPQRSSAPVPKKQIDPYSMTYINSTGTSLKFPNGRVIDPIPHTLTIYKSENQICITTDGVQFTGFNIDTKTLTQNYKELQQYNSGDYTMLVISEKLALWWVDIIDDVEWNGPIAYPEIVDGVCVKLNCLKF